MRDQLPDLSPSSIVERGLATMASRDAGRHTFNVPGPALVVILELENPLPRLRMAGDVDQRLWNWIFSQPPLRAILEEGLRAWDAHPLEQDD